VGGGGESGWGCEWLHRVGGRAGGWGVGKTWGGEGARKERREGAGGEGGVIGGGVEERKEKWGGTGGGWKCELGEGRGNRGVRRGKVIRRRRCVDKCGAYK